MCIYIYIYICMYMLNNDSASAYQHYRSYKKDIYGAKRLGSGSAELSSSAEGDEARASFLFL